MKCHYVIAGAIISMSIHLALYRSSLRRENTIITDV
jgi:hypothetical protein